MTAQEKERITRLRGEGKSYGAIATLLGISPSKVKSYCIRHELGGARSSVGRRTSQGRCEQCGAPVQQVPGRKHKRFCSDACRMKWWAAHRDQLTQKTTHTFTCRECGRPFEVYGVTQRSFCSRGCYAAFRTGRGNQ